MKDRLRDVLGEDVDAEHGAVSIVLLEPFGSDAVGRGSLPAPARVPDPRAVQDTENRQLPGDSRVWSTAVPRRSVPLSGGSCARDRACKYVPDPLTGGSSQKPVPVAPSEQNDQTRAKRSETPLSETQSYDSASAGLKPPSGSSLRHEGEGALIRGQLRCPVRGARARQPFAYVSAPEQPAPRTGPAAPTRFSDVSPGAGGSSGGCRRRPCCTSCPAGCASGRRTPRRSRGSRTA